MEDIFSLVYSKCCHSHCSQPACSSDSPNATANSLTDSGEGSGDHQQCELGKTGSWQAHIAGRVDDCNELVRKAPSFLWVGTVLLKCGCCCWTLALLTS
ncbi:hypothetical protein PBY51_001509 [Eleginops maclovinus]|uniref:Uncharacterized protein n=1 Tax=Eleginops maclovinus TaxID=56733 RepID=A0AAN7WY22_ELEMC|nr:hypothetical protein PBY51_001509 [Eleginops maclovinus]